MRDARAEFLAAHLPGAAFFDLDAASDPDAALPHMLPSAARFQALMRGIGLRDADTIVVYDASGQNLSAGRGWWMLRSFGHDRVTILDGGIQRWKHEGRPLESGPAAHPPGDFTAQRAARHVVDARAVHDAITTGNAQVVDARSAGRFAGTAPEPRPGLRGGHIPGSRNVPFTELVAPDGTMLPRRELAQLFERAGVDLARPVIATCGSGVTACAILHALHALGHADSALYDGSWAEWGGRPDLPVETGPTPSA